MNTLGAVLDVVTVAFIVATMLGAGLSIRATQVRALLRDGKLLSLALAANLVVVPLLGWAVGAAFGLGAAALTALVLLASSPGGPMGTTLGMLQRGDVTAAAAVQVVLATVGSVTFAPTAGWLLGASHAQADVTLDVARLVGAVVLLQLAPLAAGVAVRAADPRRAARWRPAVLRAANGSFLVVLAGLVLRSWDEVAGLVWSPALPAGLVFFAAALLAGALLATGSARRRTTMGSVTAVRNMGPALAAAAVAFGNDPAVLGALVTFVCASVVVGFGAAGVLAAARRDRESDAVSV